jgi:thioredoxin-related protein
MKKKFLLILMALFAFSMQAQEIKWMTLNEALKAQKKNPKPIIMDIYTDWCGPCKLLDNNTFTDSRVREYITTSFYPVKFNAEGNSEITYKGVKYGNPNFKADRSGRNSTHEFTLFLRVMGYPYLHILDEKGDFKSGYTGYRAPKEFLADIK